MHQFICYHAKPDPCVRSVISVWASIVWTNARLVCLQGEETVERRGHPTAGVPQRRTRSSMSAPQSPKHRMSDGQRMPGTPFGTGALLPSWGAAATTAPDEFPRLTVRTSSGRTSGRTTRDSMRGASHTGEVPGKRSSGDDLNCNLRASADSHADSPKLLRPRRSSSSSPQQSSSPLATTSPRSPRRDSLGGLSSSPEYTVCRICEMQVKCCLPAECIPVHRASLWQQNRYPCLCGVL